MYYLIYMLVIQWVQVLYAYGHGQDRAGKIWGPVPNSKIGPIFLLKYNFLRIANLIDT
jgi:hypothetical protein